MNKGGNVPLVASSDRSKTSAADGWIPSWEPCASGFRDIELVSAASAHRFGARFRKCLSGRVTPELRHLQVSLGAQLSYRKAADLLGMLLPPTGGTTHTSTRARLMAVGERIDEEIRQEITENRKPDKLVKQMIIGIDGAFVKGRPPTDRANLEIITGRIEADA